MARSTPAKAAITEVTAKPVRQFLSSGDAGQEVSDDGTFAKLFVQAIEGDVSADGNGDGYVTGSEIGAYLTGAISDYTENAQTPRHGKLRVPGFTEGDFVFKLASATPETPVSAQQPAGATVAALQPAQAAPAVDKELIFWDAIKNSENPGEYEAYLAQYPNGTFSALAKARVASLKAKQEPAQAPAPAQQQVAAATPPAAPAPSGLEELDRSRWINANNLNIRSGPGLQFRQGGPA